MTYNEILNKLCDEHGTLFFDLINDKLKENKMEYEKNIEITKEDILALEEIYNDIETNYKVRAIASAIYQVHDPLVDKYKRQVEVLKKYLLFLRSPHA